MKKFLSFFLFSVLLISPFLFPVVSYADSSPSRVMRLFEGFRIKLVSGRTIIYGKTVSAAAAFACGDNVTFTYNGGSVTYGTVTGADGKCWMDRNLGATQVAVSSTDTASYGHLFQWGRSPDGHQVTTSGTTATNADVPGNNLFITETVSPYDWRVNQDGTLWATSGSTNNPCPASWHVPTQAEWVTVAGFFSPQTSVGAFNSALKLPLAGYRDRALGSLGHQGSAGYYWSSSPFGTFAYDLGFSSGGVDPAVSDNRAYGFSVRCVKD